MGSTKFRRFKKNDGVRIVTDFRKLNEAIKNDPWPMPTIQDMLHQCGGMTFVTALDLIQSYYAMNIQKRMQKYLVIILPWSKYVYLKMPMGLNISADVFQRELSRLFQGMPYVLVYIDDILVITKGTFEQHLKAVQQVLEKLIEVGMQINVDKSFFATTEVDYLGYIINRKGITPQPSKVQIIIDMPKPKTSTGVKRFGGMVNFYRDLWPKRAHYLAPIMALTAGKKKNGPIV